MLMDYMQIFYCFTSSGLQLDCLHYIAFQTFFSSYDLLMHIL